MTMSNPENALALVESVKAAKSYVDIILKPPLEQIGGILSDSLGYWRLKNQVNVLLKAKRFLEDKGVRLSAKLLPSVFVPLMEEAGNTDDDALSDMFARLLSTHLDSERQDEIHPSFTKVLGQLSPLDTKVLNMLDEVVRTRGEAITIHAAPFFYYNYGRTTIIEKAEKQIAEATPGQVGLSIDNLERLGLLSLETTVDDEDVVPDGYLIGKYGHRFLIACNGRDYWRHKIVDRDDDQRQREERLKSIHVLPLQQ